MDVQKVDLANWPRREFWNHYMKEVRCTYAMTAELDASRLLPALKRRGLKLYPALIHMLSQVVHRHEEFRYNTGADGEPEMCIRDRLSSVGNTDLALVTLRSWRLKPSMALVV